MLHKEINSRLRAGALVIIVEEADEALAVESAVTAAQQFGAITVKSCADGDVLEVLDKHRTAKDKDGEGGTLILCDFLRAFGGHEIAVRFVRQMALQKRKDGEKYTKLILIEVPGVNVPQSIRGDVEYLIPKMPEVKDLKEELDGFVKNQEIKVSEKSEDRYEIASSVAGLYRHEAARLFSRSWVETQALETAWLRREKAARVSERLGGALTFVDTNTPDIGGLGNLKGWLDSRRDAFGSQKAREYGLPEPKGVLFLGPPGTGKSLTAKTTARRWNAPLLRLDAGKLYGLLVGQSEAQTRLAIDAAEACAPCVLWIDEMEKAFAQGGLDGGTSQRVFGTLLTWLQEKTKAVFVVGTANDISALPPELLRKGRFDEIFFVDLPTPKEREDIAKIHLARRGRKTIEARRIAEASDGFSGAEVEQAIVEGMFTAFAKKRDVKLDDILEAVRGTVPLSKTMENKIKILREWAHGRAKMASAPAQLEAAEAVPGRRGARIAA